MALPLILTPNNTPPSLRSFKASQSSIKHSPDGYLAQDELARHWRPLQASDPARFRSRTHLGLINVEPIFDEEEEDSSDPHPFRPPSKSDSRGPCPALGALSNHGYLPRDGRNITMWQMVTAIREGYGGSWAYALALTIVSYVIMRLGGVGKGWLNPTVDLEDLGVHGVLEHDGSLTHADVDEPDETSPHDRFASHSPSASSPGSSTAVSLSTPPPLYSILKTPSPVSSILWRLLVALVSCLPIISYFVRPRAHVYAPKRPSRRLIKELLADSASGTHLTLADVARARVRRDACTRPIPSRVIQQFAHGEFAMTVDILGEDEKVELGMLRTWLEEERLPRGWEPTHVQGLWRTHVVTGKVQALMAGLRAYRKNRRDVRTVVYE